MRSPETLYVACSGGADSVFALLLAWHFLRESNSESRLVALHFNHALRGEDSNGDARFVEELCAGLGIRYLDAKASWSSSPESVTEAMAREARLAFFREATQASLADGDLRSIVTGHHADDVVETQLMRLSRGAGTRGLAAPREVSAAGGGLRFLRPLLAFSRHEIQDALKAAGIPWREDETNESGKNYRSRLRTEVIPSWQAAADRELKAGALRSRQLCEEDSEALDAWAEAAWSDAWSQRKNALSQERVRSFPVAIRRRVLGKLSGLEAAPAAVFDTVLPLLEGGDAFCVSLPQELQLQSDGEWIAVAPLASEASCEWREFSLPVGCSAYLPDGARIELSRCPDGVGKALSIKDSRGITGNDDGEGVWLREGGNFIEGLRVRRKLPGDAFKPMGKSSVKKLKTLLIERKIRRELRNALPVFICPGGEIVWMPGLPPSDEWKLGSVSESALRLTYRR